MTKDFSLYVLPLLVLLGRTTATLMNVKQLYLKKKKKIKNILSENFEMLSKLILLAC